VTGCGRNPEQRLVARGLEAASDRPARRQGWRSRGLTGWLNHAQLPPGRTEASAAWTEAEATTEAEAGSGGEAMAEAADAAISEEAAATPTTKYVLMLLCYNVYQYSVAGAAREILQSIIVLVHG
jgi:hypothetical protein